MKTRCKNCRALIDFGNTYCKQCETIIKKNRKKDATKDKFIEDTTKSSTWQSLRKDILRRDKGCCVLCLRNNFIEHRRLEVHHIVKRKDNPDLIYEAKNLVTVCKSCHEILEKLPPSKQLELLGSFYKEERTSLL